MKHPAVVVVALLLLAACAGEDEPAGSSPQEEPDRQIAVAACRDEVSKDLGAPAAATFDLELTSSTGSTRVVEGTVDGVDLTAAPVELDVSCDMETNEAGEVVEITADVRPRSG